MLVSVQANKVFPHPPSLGCLVCFLACSLFGLFFCCFFLFICLFVCLFAFCFSSFSGALWSVSFLLLHLLFFFSCLDFLSVSGEWVLLCAWGFVLGRIFLQAKERCVSVCSFLGRHVGVCRKGCVLLMATSFVPCLKVVNLLQWQPVCSGGMGGIW